MENSDNPEMQAEPWATKRDFTVPNNRLLILSSPRTGSTALIKMLEAAGAGHQPHEFLHQYFRKKHGVTHTNALSYIRKIAMQRGTEAGWFTCKLHGNQLVRVFGEGGALAGDWIGWFIQFIWTRRRDRLAQAISEFFSSKSQEWNVASGESPPEGHDRQYHPEDMLAVTMLLARQVSEDTGWMEVIKTYKLNPITVFYEDFIADPQAVMERVAAQIGLVLPSGMDFTLPTRKISGVAAVEAFRAAYLRHLQTGEAPLT